MEILNHNNANKKNGLLTNSCLNPGFKATKGRYIASNWHKTQERSSDTSMVAGIMVGNTFAPEVPFAAEFLALEKHSGPVHVSQFCFLLL